MINEILDFTSKKIDLVIERTTTVDFTVIYTDAAQEPISLSGFTAKMQVRPRYGDGTAVLTLMSTAVSGSRLVKNDALGEIRVKIDEDDTGAIAEADYIYDLIIFKTDDVRRLMAGNFVLKDAVTGVA